MRLGSRRVGLVLGIVAASLVLTACFGSKYHYVKNSTDNAYFRIPEAWRLYDEDAVLEELGGDVSEEEREQIQDIVWQVAFDASPKPSLDHYFDPAARFPAGRAQVMDLTDEQADIVSLSDLRNFSVGIDQLIEAGGGAITREERIEREGGFRGLHVIAKVADPESGKVLTYNQILLLDQATTKLYEITVVCGTACYDDHRRDIERVIDSWTVED